MMQVMIKYRDISSKDIHGRKICRLDLVILIDCTEEFCIENIKKQQEESNEIKASNNPKALNNRLERFKKSTLPMLKHYDDMGKLKVVCVGKVCFLQKCITITYLLKFIT
ncbi:unnamed protein product [Thelazia callipaeda]|uniref:Adenylate kinase n=1 Tax=Thelazia callipaeda TaxID=103827 RepID=A0A0N5CWC3_THECL|nr:unnamed protein product [Thelazia callipaeda]